MRVIICLICCICIGTSVWAVPMEAFDVLQSTSFSLDNEKLEYASIYYQSDACTVFMIEEDGVIMYYVIAAIATSALPALSHSLCTDVGGSPNLCNSVRDVTSALIHLTLLSPFKIGFAARGIYRLGRTGAFHWIARRRPRTRGMIDLDGDIAIKSGASSVASLISILETCKKTGGIPWSSVNQQTYDHAYLANYQEVTHSYSYPKPFQDLENVDIGDLAQHASKTILRCATVKAPRDYDLQIDQKSVQFSADQVEVTMSMTWKGAFTGRPYQLAGKLIIYSDYKREWTTIRKNYSVPMHPNNCLNWVK